MQFVPICPLENLQVDRRWWAISGSLGHNWYKVACGHAAILLPHGDGVQNLFCIMNKTKSFASLEAAPKPSKIGIFVLFLFTGKHFRFGWTWMHGVLSNPEKKTVQWCCSKYEGSEKGCSSCVDIVGFPVGTKYLVDRVRWCLGGHVCFEITYLQALIRPFRLTFSSKHPTTLFLYSSYTQKKHDFRVHVDFYVGLCWLVWL